MGREHWRRQPIEPEVGVGDVLDPGAVLGQTLNRGVEMLQEPPQPCAAGFKPMSGCWTNSASPSAPATCSHQESP